MDETIARTETRGLKGPASVSTGGSGTSGARRPAGEPTDSTGTDAREGSPLGASERPGPGDPPAIGRYRVIRRLGQGGFGRVYLARDDELDRPVAIKVPNPERIIGDEDVATYLNEARALARLDHPHIVPVYDVGRTADGLCYVVSKYVEGADLADRMRQARPSFRESAGLVATVAEALHHAHTHGVVHRDIKPANLLIDDSGRPCVADFGLALRDEDYGKGAGLAGTPAYMSPEQARGEGHRVDGRSDIFSLGVVFYELLTSRKPFRGDILVEIIEQILRVEERPPRQIDDTIPRELERICQKMLAKRASERYSTARDLADDLRHFLQSGTPSVTLAFGSRTEAIPTPPGPGRPDSEGPVVKVVPKGLRSFDRHDADFFLELLPGPRDRDGLPESLRFWKTRIESTEGDATFKVGLIYGPSGCGKSSLVKAGLLPRLASHAVAVYVEANPDETEARLRKALHKACPELPVGPGLVESVAALRRGRVLQAGRKIVLVLDQFEQWLFARRGEEDSELVAALRHCDGERVQAIVLVRDDFWLAASRFLRDLEIRLLDGENSALVDLFDPRHARKVLAAFGRAYGALPDRAADLSAEQQAFLDQAVAGLAQDGKVIPVRLALFAEMVKGKPWTPATLRDVGGTEGVGWTFLEETFSASTAPPEHRLHREAAQAVLKALLPRAGTDIKGQMRSEAELRDAAGYAARPRDFADLIRILDHELRLITPTDPEGASGEGQSARSEGRRFYQLTHDYLVHSLRDWLTRKQRETPRGRAALGLAERAALWSAKSENRRLPSVWEWANIRLLTRRKDWSEPERRMMRRAGRVHGRRLLSLAILIALMTWGGYEGFGHFRAAALVEFLRVSRTSGVPALVEKLSSHRRWAASRLERLLAESPEDSREHLHASLALLEVDPSQVDFLWKRLLIAAPDELPVLREALRPHRSQLAPKLWSVFESAQSGDPRLLPTAGALALYDPESPRWAELGGKVSEALVAVNSLVVGPWLEVLRPVSGKLTALLAAIFRDKSRSETVRSLATDILADYAKDDPGLVAELLIVADPRAYRTFFPVVERRAAEVLPVFRAEIAGRSASERGADSEQVKDELAERQARAAVALVRLGHAGEVWPLLRHGSDPRLRGFIVNWLNPLGADPRTIVAELDRLESSPRPVGWGEGGRGPGEGSVGGTGLLPMAGLGHGLEARGTSLMDPILFHPGTSMRRALILALGTYGTAGLSPVERQPLIGKLLDLYRNDPDAGVHGAAEWTLRQWGQQEKIGRVDAELSQVKDRGGRRWFVNGQGQTFVLIEGPVEFRMGAPPDEPDRDPDETLHRRVISRRLAIAAKEVSVEQYRRFVRGNPQFALEQTVLDKYSPEPDGPMIGVTWFGAAAYCNWLSEAEGLPRDQWCYLPKERGEYQPGMTIPADVLRRAGYRLPTEAEWEYACRAGAMTSRYYGASVGLLGRSAWHLGNSGDRARPCGLLLPNDLGLFDMLGNAYEWCQDRFGNYQPGTDDSMTIDVIEKDISRIHRGGAFDSRPAYVRSANRGWDAPSDRNIDFGFRLARTCP